MKKIALVLTLAFAFLSANNLTLDDRNVVENFGANIVKSKLDTYDSDALGAWYLKRKYESKWRKVRDDEFELEDAKKWAFEQLKKSLNNTKPVDTKSNYNIYLKASFGKYDFKNNSFPVEGLSENSYMLYYGKNFYVNGMNGSKLTFENAKESLNFIPMSKEDAKGFLKHRKDRYGNIDREILIHYVYKITDYEEDRQFTSDGYPMTIKFTGKLISAEYMDLDKKHTLYKYEYNKNNLENNSTN